jgi:hypothetical protein
MDPTNSALWRGGCWGSNHAHRRFPRFKALTNPRDQRVLSNVEAMTKDQAMYGVIREGFRGPVGELIQRAFNYGKDPAPDFQKHLGQLEDLLKEVGSGQGQTLTTKELNDLAEKAENFACAKRAMFATEAPAGVDCYDRLK